MMKKNKEFKAWLLAKYNAKSLALAVQAFCAESKPTLSYNTVLGWASGSSAPRHFYVDSLKPQFPDCPLFN